MGSESSPAIDRFGPELKTEDPSASKKLDGSTTSTSDDGSTNAPIMSSRFDFLPANTNFTVSICAVTRSQEVSKLHALEKYDPFKSGPEKLKKSRPKTKAKEITKTTSKNNS